MEHKYNYKGKSILKQTLEKDYDTICVCPYVVNFEGTHPFLQFLLFSKNIKDNLSFIQLPNIKEQNIEQIKVYSQVFLFNLLLQFGFKEEITYDEFNEEIVFEGLFEYNEYNNLYLFFDITKVKFTIYENFINPLCLVLIDEIVNTNYVLNTKIEENIISLFKFNDELCFLCDDKNEAYEIPIVGFVAKPLNKLTYTFIFRQVAENKEAILGPFFYFKDYIDT
jgi:hypothetical protein